MAIARAAHIVGAISGNLGGSIFANTRQGLLVKHRPLKTNQHTTDQQKERSRHQLLIAIWKSLTDSEYLEWQAMASQITTTNRLGVHTTITPLSLFFRQNRVQAYLGIAIPRTPYRLTRGQPCFVDDIEFTTGGAYNVTLSFDPPSDHHYVWVYGFRPFCTSPTRGVRSWKFLGRVFFEGQYAHSIAAWWTAKLGALSAGEFVHLKFQVSTVGGIRNPPTTTTTTVLAP